MSTVIEKILAVLLVAGTVILAALLIAALCALPGLLVGTSVWILLKLFAYPVAFWKCLVGSWAALTILGWFGRAIKA